MGGRQAECSNKCHPASGLFSHTHLAPVEDKTEGLVAFSLALCVCPYLLMWPCLEGAAAPCYCCCPLYTCAPRGDSSVLTAFPD